MTQRRFSEEIAATRGYVSQIEAGVVTQVGANFLNKLALLEQKYSAPERKAGRTAEQVAPYRSNVDPTPVPMKRIPIYTFVQAGAATAYEGLPTSWDDTIEYDGPDEKAFALRVAGDSMEPRFEPGMIITVSPKYPPHNGQLVVAKIKNEGCVFKLFHHSGDGKIITLSSYNPAYKDIVLPREKLHWIYRVVRSTQNHI